jgi:hypothetical protein
MKVNLVLLACLVTLALGAVSNIVPDVKDQTKMDITRMETVDSAKSSESLEVSDDMKTSATFHKRYYYPRTYYYPHYYPKYYYPTYHYPQYFHRPATRYYNRPGPQYNTNQYYNSQPSVQRPAAQQPFYHQQTTTTSTTPSPPASVNINQENSPQSSEDFASY